MFIKKIDNEIINNLFDRIIDLESKIEKMEIENNRKKGQKDNLRFLRRLCPSCIGIGCGPQFASPDKDNMRCTLCLGEGSIFVITRGDL